MNSFIGPDINSLASIQPRRQLDNRTVCYWHIWSLNAANETYGQRDLFDIWLEEENLKILHQNLLQSLQ